MKLTAAWKLRRGDRVSVDGYMLEVVQVAPTQHAEPSVMILFLNGKARIARRDEEFLRVEDER